MKRCPTCNRTYADLSLNFCLDDGTPLTSGAAPTTDLNATIRYPPQRDTSEPPPTEIYRPAPTAAPPPPPQPTSPPPSQPPPPHWTPLPAQPAKKSRAIWWILGGLAAVLVIGVGLVVMIIALTSLGSNTNSNRANANTRDPNRNANISANANVNANANANTNANANVGPPPMLTDDFSQQKWGTGTSEFGRIWYADDEYHMVSKERTFVAMYAPSNDYSTENATVRVTARSVSGSTPSSGFGLMVHCLQSRAGQLEDYALLIYPTVEPAYEIIMHKAGNQSTLVERTPSDAIKSGSEANKLEVRIKGNQLAFYANGQLLRTITDRESYRRGRVGFYTSDVFEVAFDDLEIERTP